MKLAGMILGILGGIAGLVAALFALIFGGLGTAFEAQGASQIVGLGSAALVASIVGIVGGALALARPKIAGIIMIISAVAGVICISAFYAIGGILLLIGGIFALLGSRASRVASVAEGKKQTDARVEYETWYQTLEAKDQQALSSMPPEHKDWLINQTPEFRQWFLELTPEQRNDYLVRQSSKQC